MYERAESDCCVRTVQVVEQGVIARPQCPVCGCTVDFEPYFCPACQTVHHRECWHYAGGCAIYGCLGRPEEGGRPLPVFVEAGTDAALATVAKGRTKLASAWRVCSEVAVTYHDFPVETQLVISGLVGAMGILIKQKALSFRYLAVVGSWSDTLLFVSHLLLCVVLLLLGCAYHRHLFGLARVNDGSDAVPEKSRKELTGMIMRDPKNVHVIEELAYRCFRAGELDEARDLYEQALALKPHSQLYRDRLDAIDSIER